MATKKVITIQDQINKLKSKELQQQCNFLRKQGTTDEVLGFILSQPDNDFGLLRHQYKTVHEAYIKTVDCNKQAELDRWEDFLIKQAKSFIEKHKEDFRKTAESSIGNKQAHAIRVSQKLYDNRRLDVVVNAKRLIPLEPEEIQKPSHLMKAMKETFVDNGLKKTVNLRDYRRRTISLLTGSNKPKDDTFEYSVTLNIRERTKTEEKEDMREKMKMAEVEQIEKEIEAEQIEKARKSKVA